MSIHGLPPELVLRIFTLGSELESQRSITHFQVMPHLRLSRRPKPFAVEVIPVCQAWRALVYATPHLWFTSAALTNCSTIDFASQMAIYKHILQSSQGCDIDLAFYFGKNKDQPTPAPPSIILSSSLFVHAIQMLIPYLRQVRVLGALIRDKILFNSIIGLLTHNPVISPRIAFVFLSFGHVRSLGGNFNSEFATTPHEPWLYADDPWKIERVTPNRTCLLNYTPAMELCGINIWGSKFLPRSIKSLKIVSSGWVRANVSWSHLEALVTDLPCLEFLELEFPVLSSLPPLPPKRIYHATSLREISLGGNFVSCYAFLSCFQTGKNLDYLEIYLPEDAGTPDYPRLSISEGHSPLLFNRIFTFGIDTDDIEMLELVLFWIRPAMVHSLRVREFDPPNIEQIQDTLPSLEERSKKLQIADIYTLRVIFEFSHYLLPRLRLENLSDLVIERPWPIWLPCGFEIAPPFGVQYDAPNLTSLALRTYETTQDITLFSSVIAPKLETLSIFLQGGSGLRRPYSDTAMIVSFCLEHEEFLSQVTKLTIFPPPLDTRYRNPFLSFAKVQILHLDFGLDGESNEKEIVQGLGWLSAEQEFPLLPELRTLVVRITFNYKLVAQSYKDGIKLECEASLELFRQTRTRWGFPIPEISITMPF